MAAGKEPPSVHRPLMARPGARFACFSDGLCCSDVHALGPLTRSEVRAMRALVPGSVDPHPGIDAPCMRPGGDGMCAQREGGLCGIHKRFGAAAKPDGCRRFPYGLLSTPEGGRVTTEQRCPCRTLGARPPLDLADAERSLAAPSGRLQVDHRAPTHVPVAAGQRVPFARYREVERTLIDRLLAGERAEDVLDTAPLPELHRGAWPVLAAAFYDTKDGGAGDVAARWFADALMHLCEGLTPSARPRPWAASFDKAIARGVRQEDPEQLLNDWLADELWMMRWLDWRCTFDVARAELATRLEMARYLVELLVGRGLRGDQAAAEAVMIIEIGTCSDPWTDAVDAIANDPSPAPRLF